MTVKDWFELAALCVAMLVSIVGVVISIRNRKRETRSLEAKTNLDEAQQASIVKQLADSTEEMYLKRIEGFKDDIRLLREELEDSRRETRAALAEARSHGWTVDDPPSWLMFLHEKGQNDE